MKREEKGERVDLRCGPVIKKKKPTDKALLKIIGRDNHEEMVKIKKTRKRNRKKIESQSK